MLCFSRETLTIVEYLGLTSEQWKDGEAIISAIKSYTDGHINESVELHNFFRRVQQCGEAFDDFIVALRELVKTCNFCSPACAAKSIRDQIIEGILDGDTIEHLLQQQNLTLDKAITMCRAEEAAKKQRSDITLSQNDSILTVRKQPTQKRSPIQLNPQMCSGCGGRPHQGGRNQCPAYNSTFHYCQKVGHYARACHSKQANHQSGYPQANSLLRLP